MTLSENTGETGNGPIRFPYAIEPMFWGTGEMLLWEFEQLLPEIDRSAMFSELASGETGGPIQRDEFEAIADDVSRMLAEDAVQDGPRGFYSFFPVFPEKASLVVLDPSDFHSELLTLSFSDHRSVDGHPLIDFFRPDGDVIAFSTFATGTLTSSTRFSADGKSAVAAIYTAFNRHIRALIEERINGEIRRAMGIETGIGRSFSFPPAATVTKRVLARLAELLSIEERLDIVSDKDIIHEEYPAIVRFFVHHPAVA
ncbi:MAG: hypothetical protein JW863_19295 [Chitinispirillaceae bacterium]|nr:hypothetical protein [Chitinispirillaceae bacterium]